MVAGAVMITAVKQVRDGDVRNGHISAHHRTGNVCHAAGHDGEEFRFRHAFQERAHRNGRLGLSHDNAGGHAGGFRAAGAHEALHDDRHGFHANLHHAEIIKNGEKGANENNNRQDLEGDDDAETAVRQARACRRKQSWRQRRNNSSSAFTNWLKY